MLEGWEVLKRFFEEIVKPWQGPCCGFFVGFELPGFRISLRSSGMTDRETSYLIKLAVSIQGVSLVHVGIIMPSST